MQFAHMISFTRPSAPLTLHFFFLSNIIVGEGSRRPGDKATYMHSIIRNWYLHAANVIIIIYVTTTKCSTDLSHIL